MIFLKKIQFFIDLFVRVKHGNQILCGYNKSMMNFASGEGVVVLEVLVDGDTSYICNMVEH